MDLTNEPRIAAFSLPVLMNDEDWLLLRRPRNFIATFGLVRDPGTPSLTTAVVAPLESFRFPQVGELASGGRTYPILGAFL